MSDFVKNYQVFAMTTDPVYIGTGGYTIGRVDNTIVRDPITNVPKIPGSSLAGVWRYYAVLEIFSKIKDEYRNITKRKNNGTYKGINDIFNIDGNSWITDYENNKYIRLKCAGQDDEPNKILSESRESETGHCGHCLVCKGFGFSKKDISWQGMLYFSDLNILFFPVFTMYGTKWITTDKILKMLNLYTDDNDTEICIVLEKIEEESKKENERKNGKEIKEENEEKSEIDYINLGWLYLPYKVERRQINLSKFSEFGLNLQDIVIVPDNLFSQIVNSNLEIRTSVSIDPITGAAKEGALFTSEAIPRGTILYGNIRIFDKSSFKGIDNKLEPLPSIDSLECALKESKHFFETLGIGGMTTRGFGRLKIQIDEINDKECENASTPPDMSDSQND
jgi:CRISPR-associated protein Cmr4